MAGFLDELKTDLRSRIPVLLWLIVSVALAISGPFGSYGEMPLIQRLAFWAPVMGVGVGLSTVIRAWVYGALGLRDTLAGSLLTTVLICLLLCPPLWLLVQVTFRGTGPDMPGVGEIVLLIASVSLGVCALRQSAKAEGGLAFADPPAPADPAPPPPEPEPLSRLVRRLEPGVQGALWSISVRDHYVDARTSAGQASLLMRLSDAMAEAEPVEGIQVHRSHWVAWAAVAAAEREGARLFLRLQDGARIPVSRAHRPRVEARLAGGEAVVSDAA